jgi:hypothetical protein
MEALPPLQGEGRGRDGVKLSREAGRELLLRQKWSIMTAICRHNLKCRVYAGGNMSVRISFVMLFFLMCSSVCHAKTERWSNFAEDNDLKYYMDQRSIIALPDNVFIFWVKSVPKDKDFFKREYNLHNGSYMFTSYELDCAVSNYRVRGTIMFDKNRKEISKSIAEGETVFEPVPPESMLELAQDEICIKEEGGAEISDGAERPAAAPKAPTPPEAPTAPEEPGAAEEPPALQ